MAKIFTKRWKYIPYICGWFWGVSNPLFWIIHSFLYYRDAQEDDFFSQKFHVRTYKFGWGMIALQGFYFILGFWSVFWV